MSKIFFLASSPAFSSTSLIATSPREITSSAIPVVSLILRDNLITLSNNLLRILPEIPALFALANDNTISSNISCFPRTGESNPDAKRNR